MKTFGRTVCLLILVSIFIQGCSPERVAPDTQEAPAIAGAFLPGNNIVHGRGPVMCGNPVQLELTDANLSMADLQGRKYGQVVVNNSADSIYINADLTPGWFIDQMCWYSGNSYVGPTSYGTEWDTALPGNCNPAIYYNDWSVRQAMSGSNNCSEMVLAIEIIRVHPIYGPNESTRCWVFARSTPSQTGLTVGYCSQACPVSAQSSIVM